ncbi:MAG: sterol desaturase family protein [Xanthomonadales bacterium]|nr:sterol desaturase family protein [Xanthomonadales bacterium]
MSYLLDALSSSWQQFQLICVIFCAGLAVESLLPAEGGQPLKHVGFNILYTVIFLLLTNLLAPSLMALIRPWIEQWGVAIPVEFPDGFAGQLGQVLVFLLIMDFFYYWFHRAQHLVPALWAQHKLHHSETSLNITTSSRHHWLEEPFRVFAMWLPIGLLFQQRPMTIAWLWSFFLLWGYVIHLNVRLPLGPLTPVLCGPQLHRIHHSRLPEHADRNFAAFFPIFDLLFGTYCRPDRNTYPATGLHDGEDLNGVFRSSLSPFRDWLAMLGRHRDKSHHDPRKH